MAAHSYLTSPRLSALWSKLHALARVSAVIGVALLQLACSTTSSVGSVAMESAPFEMSVPMSRSTSSIAPTRVVSFSQAETSTVLASLTGSELKPTEAAASTTSSVRLAAPPQTQCLDVSALRARAEREHTFSEAMECGQKNYYLAGQIGGVISLVTLMGLTAWTYMDEESGMGPGMVGLMILPPSVSLAALGGLFGRAYDRDCQAERRAYGLPPVPTPLEDRAVYSSPYRIIERLQARKTLTHREMRRLERLEEEWLEKPDETDGMCQEVLIEPGPGINAVDPIRSPNDVRRDKRRQRQQNAS